MSHLVFHEALHEQLKLLTSSLLSVRARVAKPYSKLGYQLCGKCRDGSEGIPRVKTVCCACDD